MSTNILPFQNSVQLNLQHSFNFDFADVAKAFLLKYNIENKFCCTTIASTRMIDEDRFEIVRRMENIMSSRPVYERIIFNRKHRCVQGFTFEKEEDNVYSEHYVYKQDDKDAGKTVYNMFLYKNPGFKKMLRYKLHGWGVQTLESIIKKEQEFKAKIEQGKDKIKETGEKLKEMTLEQKEKILETKDKIKEKISDLTNNIHKKESADKIPKEHKEI